MQRLASQPAAETARPELELSEETYRELGLPDEEDEMDSTRQTSDFQVYAYYIKTAGAWTFTIYMIICAAYIFGLNFPCKFLAANYWYSPANVFFSNLAPMVD